MPINRTFTVWDASATRSVSPSVHDTTRPSVDADHAGIASATIAANKIMNRIACPPTVAIARSPAQDPPERANAVLAERNLSAALEHQGVCISRPRHDAPHLLEIDEVAPVSAKEAVRRQSVLQSIKRHRHSKLPGVGNDKSSVPHAGAVPGIADRYETDFVLAANWQDGGDARARRAGLVR